MQTLSQQARAHHAQCHRKDESERLLLALADENDRLNHEMEATKEAARAREAILRGWVVAFCAPIAGKYAQDFGLPDGHLHPRHYDILEECGARMDDFTRAALNGEGGQ